jgi:hypothetical protein
MGINSGWTLRTGFASAEIPELDSKNVKKSKYRTPLLNN